MILYTFNKNYTFKGHIPISRFSPTCPEMIDCIVLGAEFAVTVCRGKAHPVCQTHCMRLDELHLQRPHADSIGRAADDG